MSHYLDPSQPDAHYHRPTTVRSTSIPKPLAMTPTHRRHPMTDKPATCDIPGCKGRREILIMEDEMRCVCRKCFRQMEGATP